MLIDINLLPKRDEKNIASYAIIAGIVFVLIILTVTFTIYVHNKKQDLDTIEQQVKLNQKLVEEQQKKLTDFQSSKSVTDLEQAIKWAKNQPVDLVYVLKELTKALPQRGFVQEFDSDEDYVITQQVKFDTKSDAAYYLHAILDIPWVSEAVMSEGKNSDLEEGNALANTVLVPRYLATYEIKLDFSKLRNEVAEQKSAAVKEEGADTP